MPETRMEARSPVTVIGLGAMGATLAACWDCSVGGADVVGRRTRWTDAAGPRHRFTSADVSVAGAATLGRARHAPWSGRRCIGGSSALAAAVVDGSSSPAMRALGHLYAAVAAAGVGRGLSFGRRAVVDAVAAAELLVDLGRRRELDVQSVDRDDLLEALQRLLLCWTSARGLTRHAAHADRHDPRPSGAQAGWLLRAV